MLEIKQINMRESIGNAIKRYIIENQLMPGDKLPSESEMLNMFKTSRTSLREALRMLEGGGLVTVRQGDGVFVAQFDGNLLVENLQYSISFSGQDIRDILEVRQALELHCIMAAAESIDEEQLRVLDQVVTKMENCGNEEAHKLDMLFHNTLYKNIPNQFAAKLIAMYWDLLITDYLPKNIAFMPTMNIENHRLLLKALKQKNPHLAYYCMQIHMEDISHILR